MPRARRIWVATVVVVLVHAAAATAGDGRIAYTSFKGRHAGDIWTMDADGTDAVRVVSDRVYDAQPDWSPDGTRIAFRRTRGGRFQVSIADLRSGRITDTRRAPDGTQSSQPAWFPNGRGLLYRRTGGRGRTRSDIWAMDVDGSHRRAVAVLPGDQMYPSYSPDMTKVLFATLVPGGGRSIQVMDVADGAVTTLFDATARSYDSAPAWSPDGRRIAFESDLDGDMEIFVMDADGRNVRKLTDNALRDEGPAWSPHGTRLAFARAGRIRYAESGIVRGAAP
jgi:TolB protein